jgi:hypothetical protein
MSRARVVVSIATSAIGLAACHRYGPPQPVSVTYASTSAAPGASSSEPTYVDADAVIVKNRWRFKACYTAALKVDRNAAGTIQVVVHVGSSGEVTSAKVEATTAGPDLSQCIADAFLQMVFPAPQRDDTAMFTVPVVLSAKK